MRAVRFIGNLGLWLIFLVTVVVSIVEVIFGILGGSYGQGYYRSIYLPLPVWGVIILLIVMLLRRLTKRSESRIFNAIAATPIVILVGFYIYIVFVRFDFPQITSTVFAGIMLVQVFKALRSVKNPTASSGAPRPIYYI